MPLYKDTATLEKALKSPCDKCTIIKTYYENPCWACIHNPKSPEEILENYRTEIFRERFDRFTNHKFAGEVKETVLISKDRMLETYQCGACQKKFVTVEEKHRATYCPTCGSKIKYGVPKERKREDGNL